MGELTQLFESIMQIQDISSLSIDEALETTGQLIDLSLDFQQINGLEKAFAFLEDIKARPITSIQEATLHYFWANAWSNIRYVSRADDKAFQDWEQVELEEEIYHLRQALQIGESNNLPEQLHCRILTNLGNLLSSVGRFVDAIEYWNRALALNPQFSMAQANKGLCLCHYARVVYDRHNAIRMVEQAKSNLEEALSSQSIHQDARTVFERYLQWAIETDRKNGTKKHEFAQGTFGVTEQEIRYRTWVTQNRLFLNHLNDIQTDSDVAQDNLILPSIVQPINDGLHYHGLFNQLKQEFISARYIYYEGISSEGVHFSDNKVDLYNTLDYPSYSLSVEKIKIAFRVAYSLFDKTAFFLNSYLKLGIHEKKVNFKTCWYQSQDRKRGLRKELTERRNLPLRGLFWLSKDLFEDGKGFRDAIEPHAKELSVIRNHLEHKYLKIHEFGVPTTTSHFHDELAFSVGRYELVDKTLHLLKLSRATLIYISLAVYSEEEIKTSSRDSGKVGNMELRLLKNDWKF